MTKDEAIKKIRKQLPAMFLDILPEKELEAEIISVIREYISDDFVETVNECLDIEIQKIVKQEAEGYRKLIKERLQESSIIEDFVNKCEIELIKKD